MFASRSYWLTREHLRLGQLALAGELARSSSPPGMQRRLSPGAGLELEMCIGKEQFFAGPITFRGGDGVLSGTGWRGSGVMRSFRSRIVRSP